MSSFENENIDRLFASLEDHSMDVELDQFNDMEVRLESMRYFRFGWKHFNIYYTGIIGLSLLFSTCVLVETLRRPPAETKVIMVPADSLREAPAAMEVVPETKVVPQISRKFAPVVTEDSAVTPDATPVILPPVVAPVRDTTPVVPPAPKIKKIVVIPKRDTIIKYDTTKVIKRK